MSFSRDVLLELAAVIIAIAAMVMIAVSSVGTKEGLDGQKFGAVIHTGSNRATGS